MMKYVHDSFVNVPIDLRHDAKILTDEFGIDVLYVRQCKYVKCSCFDDLNKTGNPDCPMCHGSGWFSSIQKVKAIESRNAQGAYGSGSSLAKMDIGITDQMSEIFYIQQQYNPKERDFLLKVTWKDGMPVDILKVLEIINVWEMRGDDGRNELNGCVISDRTDLVNAYRKMLATLPKKAIYQMAKGGKSIWPSITQP